FKDIDSYKNGNISYNPEVPSYSAEYQLSNKDVNVKKLRKTYNIPTNKAPKLTLNGTGELSGSSTGNKDIEYLFLRDKNSVVKFTDSISFKPTN
ncbi:Csa1 family protein, partial [Staphylococcus sp. HMSC62A08]|uniref:Csa1 family protein n=2 Tax=Staphylococcus TaxID=1279 RepID=UPI00114D1806